MNQLNHKKSGKNGIDSVKKGSSCIQMSLMFPFWHSQRAIVKNKKAEITDNL